MAPLIDENCSLSSYNADIDIDSGSVSTYLSEGVEQVVMTDTSKILSTFPLHAMTAIVKKNVHFSEETSIHSILGRADYTADEVTSTWYNHADLKEMRDAARCEAKLLMAGLLQETMHTSARGLEGRTTEGLTRKRRNRAEAANAVFDELDQQDEQGIVDDDALADIYFTFTERCQVAAQMMGMRDANLANEVSKEPEKQNLFHTVPPLPSNFIYSLSTSERLISSAA
jgi:hypothetical protein